MATKKTTTTPATEQANTEEKLSVGLESSRYSKQEQQRMSDGMVP
ncbi:hypothetical protein JCM14036_11950 [Desulfotomaculum defluvii]